jgi:hypothetical protein
MLQMAGFSAFALFWLVVGYYLTRRRDSGATVSSLGIFPQLPRLPAQTVSAPRSRAQRSNAGNRNPFERFPIDGDPVLISPREVTGRQRYVSVSTDQDVLLWNNRMVEPNGTGYLVTATTPTRLGPIDPHVEIYAVRSGNNGANIAVATTLV